MTTLNRSRLACSIAMAASMTGIAHADQALEIQETRVVSAAGYEQNIADAPASISVITREELNKQAYTDVVDAVKNIPGVYVTGGGNAQDISIRGMTSSYTLYLVDGRPVSAGRNVMSAIDFKMDLQREPDPNGDRVKIVMSGKFLPYKSY